MDPTTATTVLLVLGSAFGVMFATMTSLMVVSIRVQHRESEKIRTSVGLQIEQAMDRLRAEFTNRLDDRFDGLDGRFDAIDARFDAIDGRFDARFDGLDIRFDAIDARFDAIDGPLRRVEADGGPQPPDHPEAA